MIRIKVKPNNKDKMYIIGSVVSISNSLLCKLSDTELRVSLLHELGHYNQRWKMFGLIFLYTFLFIVLTFVLIMVTNSFYSLPLLFIVYYICCCWVCRIGEYMADRYASRYATIDEMREFIFGLNHDCSDVFYFFRWHSSNERRIIALESNCNKKEL